MWPFHRDSNKDHRRMRVCWNPPMKTHSEIALQEASGQFRSDRQSTLPQFDRVRMAVIEVKRIRGSREDRFMAPDGARRCKAHELTRS